MPPDRRAHVPPGLAPAAPRPARAADTAHSPIAANRAKPLPLRDRLPAMLRSRLSSRIAAEDANPPRLSLPMAGTRGPVMPPDPRAGMPLALPLCSGASRPAIHSDAGNLAKPLTSGDPRPSITRGSPPPDIAADPRRPAPMICATRANLMPPDRRTPMPPAFLRIAGALARPHISGDHPPSIPRGRLSPDTAAREHRPAPKIAAPRGRLMPPDRRTPMPPAFLRIAGALARPHISGDHPPSIPRGRLSPDTAAREHRPAPKIAAPRRPDHAA